MTRINLTTEEEIIKQLEIIANERESSLESLINEILGNYIKNRSPKNKMYSFIGIGKSGRKNRSRKVEEVLNDEANRREGWSLDE